MARRYVEIGHFPTGAAWRGVPPKVKELLQQRAKLALREWVLCRRVIDHNTHEMLMWRLLLRLDEIPVSHGKC